MTALPHYGAGFATHWLLNALNKAARRWTHHSPLPIPPTLEPVPHRDGNRHRPWRLPLGEDGGCTHHYPFPIPHSPVILNKLLKLLHLRV
ncbi:hypothetical protein NIES4075_54140 [Tolypothrix sp. NIES-4075]|uniref:hypothetical protein n=1 Tax=Tolypothrix sp. NIES-4075 TaxID=2005459 RepID=UPI000B62D55A|nr:hypothetical protein [Tolypothrix sp. NIES-4075]GAX44396.1 hypothetical protein NIES4075_54140 [Tolypothrix sp. NIES-4075]